MAEETEEKTKSKLESRKFIVWLVWLIITLLIIVYCGIVIILTKDVTDNFSTLLEKVLGWFFGISMMYIGANAGQKVGFAFADAMSSEKKVEE